MSSCDQSNSALVSDANYVVTQLHSSIATVVFGSAAFLSNELKSLPHWTFSPK